MNLEYFGQRMYIPTRHAKLMIIWNNSVPHIIYTKGDKAQKIVLVIVNNQNVWLMTCTLIALICRICCMHFMSGKRIN